MLCKHKLRIPMWQRLHQIFVQALVLCLSCLFQTSSAQQWTIEKPTIEYQGLQLSLEYTISSPLKEGDTVVTIFRDDSFNEMVENSNQYLKSDTFYDGSSGVQKVAVTLDINEGKILSAPFVSSVGLKTIVSIGTRLSIPNPAMPSQTAAFQDTSIIFELSTDGNFQIVGLLEEQEDKYGVNVFECDSNNNRLPFVQPKSQSDFLRICIQPDEFTEKDAVKIYGVTELTLDDGQSTQEVMSNGAVQSLGDTDYGCVQDGNLCFIETSIKTNFFATRQTVSASGIARLQYIRDNGRRKLIEAPVHVRRRARTAGGQAGDISFEISLDVEPSSASYGARAYLCDERKKGLSQDEIEPIKFGEAISVCITPDQEALEEDVFIRDVRSFVFKKNGDEQYLEKPREEEERKEAEGGDKSEQSTSTTLYDCTGGTTVCAFRLVLDDIFFDGDGQPIEGEGEIELQFGSGKSDWSRRTKFSVALPGHRPVRSLQSKDPSFAGTASASLSIPVDPSSTAPPVAWAAQSLNFWASMPTYGRVLVIVGIAMVVIAFLLCGLCFVFGIDSLDFLPCDLPHFMTKQSEDDFDRDFTDPEEFREDTQIPLKDDGGCRGRSLSRLSNGRLRSRSRSGMRSSSPTKSLSSHSRSEISVEGRMKVRSKARLNSLSPTRDRISKSFQSLFPSSFHGRDDRRSRSERLDRTIGPGKGRTRSMSPSRRINGESCQSFKSALAHGRIIPNDERKPRKKAASSHSRIGPTSKSERQKRSIQPPNTRTRSLSPTRSLQTKGARKSVSSHGPPKKKTSQTSKVLKASSEHDLSRVPPKRKISSSTHSRKASKEKKKEQFASQRNEDLKSSAHSLGSCSFISEVSINSGNGGKKIKGRKSDTLSVSSSHSVQSFASNGTSIYSTDDDLDLSTDGAPELKRGKRPTAKNGKKKKAKRMSNTNDIISSMD